MIILKLDLREIGRDFMHWKHMAQDVAGEGLL
jgi:hypothetical protein